MNRVLLEADAEKGYNFSCIMPHFWFTYTVDGDKYMKVEILCWGMHQNDVTPQMDQFGKVLKVSSKIPDRSLDVSRLWELQYSGMNGSDTTMCQAASAIIKDIRDANNMGPIESVIEIKLPFKCKQRFQDPYDNGANAVGFEFAAYPYDGGSDLRQVYMLHINLAGVDESRADYKGKSPFKAYGFPPPS
jgi:hypothetical protein